MYGCNVPVAQLLNATDQAFQKWIIMAPFYQIGTVTADVVRINIATIFFPIDIKLLDLEIKINIKSSYTYIILFIDFVKSIVVASTINWSSLENIY